MSYFSNKIPLNPEKNQLLMQLQSLKEKNVPIFDLTHSNPTLAGFEYPSEIFQNFQLPNYKPSPRGLVEAREAICEYYSQKGRIISIDNIFLTTGSSESMSFCLKMLCDFGDEVCLPSPGYPLYDYIAKLENVKPIYYSLKKQELHWRMDFQSLENRINHKTKAIVIVQPNNPTGNILTKGEIEALIELAFKNKLVLIVDEVFSDYCYENDFLHLTSNHAPVITLNGISKIAGLPQLKLGWFILEGNQEFTQTAIDSMETIADTYLSVNTPIQMILGQILENAGSIQMQIRDRLTKNLKRFKGLFGNQKRITYHIPEGGWYIVFSILGCIDGDEFCLNLLTQKFVFVYPGYMFDFMEEDIFVISLLTPEIEFNEGLRRLMDFTMWEY
ncbi:MAG: pyridoxal phosphate-dependent aminotransferase [Leptospiraceae bacterium]|nr:pyridoxal phosphate-dependent aminotransferase [Leptospiraceae bacterium]MCP5497148.1 pyridoxal phosphate-dependent aminotransferase [Leptospiraceae bacterium]